MENYNSVYQWLFQTMIKFYCYHLFLSIMQKNKKYTYAFGRAENYNTVKNKNSCSTFLFHLQNWKKTKQNAIEECQENHGCDYFQDDAELKYANLKSLFNHLMIV